MGEFNAAVSTLLEAFNSGIAIIRSLRRRRKESKSEIDNAVRVEEARLSKSLKKNRGDVRSVYKTKLGRLGRRFEDGDAKAHTSLTSILFRLNAGFVSIIDRFTRGESTRADYQTLVNLSNTSRIEAIKTFEQLSTRISKSSASLATSKPKHKAHSSSKGHKPSSSQSSGTSPSRRPRPAHSRSAPELSIKQTALGPATGRGWVRLKGLKSDRRRATDQSSPRRRSDRHGLQDPPVAVPAMPSSVKKHIPSALPPAGIDNRMSIMSFASDSTKLGEIPVRRGPTTDSDNQPYPTSTVYPLAPWKRPDKPRSRFMRLFGK